MRAVTARRHSESFLAKHAIPRNPGLPLIEEASALAPPLAGDVARRILVLGCVIGVGYDADRRFLIEYLKSNALWDSASARERALLAKERVSRQERIDATWLTECVQVLAWGLRLVELDHFRPCDEDLASHVPTPRESPARFLADARLRPFDDVYRQCDLLYCLHWAAREDRLRGRSGRLDEGVIRERHRAIGWLAGVEADWDEVPTDT